MERTFPTAQKASRLHRGGSNAGGKVIHRQIPCLLSTMAAGSEYEKEEGKEATKLESFDRFSRTPDEYTRMANVVESHTPC